jgi:hypothetical protein
MYGTPVARAAMFLFPPLRVAAVSRFGLYAIFGLIVSGAVGLDYVAGDGAARRSVTPVIVAAVAASAIALIIAAFVWTQRAWLIEEQQWGPTIHSTTTALWMLAASVAAVFVIATRPKIRVLALLPVALLSIELIGFADGFHAPIPKAMLFPPVPELARPESDPALFRVVGWADTLPPNTASVYGLDDVRGYDGMFIRRYSELLEVGFQFTGSAHHLVDAATPHLLDLLNVKYVLTPPDVDLSADRFALVDDGPMHVYVNRKVLPRAFLVDTYVVADGDAARRAIRDGVPDLSRTAIIDRDLDPAERPQPAGGDPGAAIMRRYEDETVVIATSTSGRRLLMLSDAYYPGWVATVDGTPVTIERADCALRAVSVPPGEHLVEFSYRPMSLRVGALISLIAALAVMWLLWPRRRS